MTMKENGKLEFNLKNAVKVLKAFKSGLEVENVKDLLSSTAKGEPHDAIKFLNEHGVIIE